MTNQELIAQFLASREVTRVETGIRTIDENVFRRNRGDNLARALGKSEDDLINERHIVGDHVRNGLGEWIA